MKKLLLAGICAIAFASTTRAALTALDGNNVTWTYAGYYLVSGGGLTAGGVVITTPAVNWTLNPPVYSGLDAANLLFGAPAAGFAYAISTAGNFVTHTAHLDGWGDDQYMLAGASKPENYSLDLGPAGYNNPTGTAGTAYSAFVQDHTIDSATNYVWGRSLTSPAVPEPSTFAAGALLALPFGLQGVRWLRNRRPAA